MKSECCEFEEAVTAAVRSGNWSDALREHVVHCEDCADLQLVAEYCAAAMEQDDEMPLPSAGFLWWRAQLAEHQEQAKRAVAAIEIVQKIAVAMGVAGVFAMTMLWKPEHWGVLIVAAILLASTSVVLYGWVRGRI